MKYFPRVVTKHGSPITVPKHTFTNGQTFGPFTVTGPIIDPGEPRVFPDSPKVESWKDLPPKGKSFKEIKQLREIKMTNYRVGNVTTNRYLGRINRSVTRVLRPGAYLTTSKGCEIINYGFQPVISNYIDQYDAIRAADSFPVVEYSDYPTPEDIQRKLNDLISDVVSNSFSGIDLLTELAEFPETLGLLISLFKTALRPIQGMKELQKKYERSRARGNTHAVAHAEIASQWMQYRYGIMPIVYSIKDAIELLDKAFDEFKTDRSFSVLSSKAKLVPSTETHLAIYRAHEVRISVVGKSRYLNPSQRFSDLITTNLFLTAWEMIPLSFVIDWFINVGDLIFSNTSAFVDLSEDRQFCYSIRRSLVDKHVLNYKFVDGVKMIDPDYPSADAPCKIPGATFDNRTDVIGSVTLYDRTENSYERVVFTPAQAVKPDLGVNLNWMRMLDAYALSYKPIRKLFKKYS